MRVRNIKRNTLAAMRSTVRVQLRAPLGMTRAQVIRAMRKMVRNGFRGVFEAA